MKANRTCLLLLLIWLVSPSSWAASQVRLTDQQTSILLYNYLDYLHDASGKLTLQDIMTPPYNTQFINTGENSFAQGFTNDAFWLRIAIDNQASAEQQWLVQVLEMEESPLSVYLTQDNSAIKPELLKADGYFSFHDYLLNLKKNGQYWLYVRVQGSADPLVTSFRFIQKQSRVDIQRLLFYTAIGSGLIALGLYNLLLFIILRDPSYGWLSVFILSITLEMSRYTGLLYQYLGVWPEYSRGYLIFALLAIASYNIFLRHILSTARHIPRLDKAFRLLFLLSVVVIGLLPWLSFLALWAGILALSSGIITLVAIHCLGRLRITLVNSLRWAFGILWLGLLPVVADSIGIYLHGLDIFAVELWAVFLFALLLSIAQAEFTRIVREQAASATAANQAKNAFLTTMSHELRTPMNAVVGTGILLRNTPLTLEQQSFVDKLDIAARHMLDLVNDILDFARIEQNELTLEQVPFELNSLLQELYIFLQDQAQHKKLHFLIDNPLTQATFIQSDPIRLKQILLNLLSNALKFTHRGSVVLSIDIKELTSEWITLTFSVTDTGIGISEKQQLYLFQPFSQADTSTTRRYGGSGLGLAISQRLVIKMGGRLTLKSALGEGSSFAFTLTFPLTNQMPVHSKAVFKPVKYVQAIHVLLVDDDELNQFFMLKLLGLLNVTVTVVGDGYAAIEQVKQASFDLVFMDVSMPEMDGYETTRHIRAFKISADLPIIALTAHTLAGERERCLAAGMDDFLTKPFIIQDLQAILHAWVRYKE